MTIVLTALLVFSLFLIFCVRHFFVQLLAVKLLVDALVLLVSSLRNPDQAAFNAQTTAVFISSLGALVFFVLLAAGIQRFSRAEKRDLEVQSE